jgi:hypothetical protein
MEKKEMPLPVIALIAVSGVLLLEFLPHYASRLYEGYTETIISVYYTLSYIFMAAILITLALLAVSNVLNAWVWVTFRWKPSTAYLAGETGAIIDKESVPEEKEEKKEDTYQE